MSTIVQILQQQARLTETLHPIALQQARLFEEANRSVALQQTRLVEEASRSVALQQTRLVEEATRSVALQQTRLAEEATRSMALQQTRLVEEATRSVALQQTRLAEEATRSMALRQTRLVEEATRSVALQQTRLVEEATRSMALQQTRLVEEATRSIALQQTRLVEEALQRAGDLPARLTRTLNPSAHSITSPISQVVTDRELTQRMRQLAKLHDAAHYLEVARETLDDSDDEREFPRAIRDAVGALEETACHFAFLPHKTLPDAVQALRRRGHVSEGWADRAEQMYLVRNRTRGAGHGGRTLSERGRRLRRLSREVADSWTAGRVRCQYP